MEAYPLLTRPVFQDYIWGGRRLGTELGKEIPDDGQWAESWEVVDHAQQQSVIANGHLAGQELGQIAKAHAGWLLGDEKLTQVPLLLKYLDCNRVLSVQVHPDDTYAQAMAVPDLGKTEAWYILAAEPGAKLYAGLNAGVGPAELSAALATGSVEECLHVIEPTAGDCVFIPAGTVHALGAGLLVAEIQQASNTTFRLFDWKRLGNDGQPRPLHIEQSLEVIDFDDGPRQLQQPVRIDEYRENLVTCDKFVLDRVSGSGGSIPLQNAGHMHFVTSPASAVTLSWAGGQQELSKGQSAILPAAMPEASLQVPVGSAAECLLMRLPD